MLTLTELSSHFACLDDIKEDDLPAYDKALRNLTQRHNLPVASQRGRVFLYSEGGAAAIRLAQIASEFELSRYAIGALTSFMASTHHIPRPKPGLQPNMMEEAARRVRAGETFNVNLIMSADFQYRCEADWVKEPVNEKVDITLKQTGRDHAAELARFVLPASRLIADVCRAFEDQDG